LNLEYFWYISGIDDPFEAPKNSELVIDTANKTVEDSANIIIDLIKKYI
jgi:adenylylsulfate kinase-like enzyme